jgi:predicted DNA repair protein MutK
MWNFTLINLIITPILLGGLASQAHIPRFFAPLFAAGGVFPRFPDFEKFARKLR